MARMNEDPRLLAHKQRVDAERRAKAIGKRNITAHNNRLMMARVAAAKKEK